MKATLFPCLHPLYSANRVGPCPCKYGTWVARRHICNANTKQALLSCDITTKLVVKWHLLLVISSSPFYFSYCFSPYSPSSSLFWNIFFIDIKRPGRSRILEYIDKVLKSQQLFITKNSCYIFNYIVCILFFTQTSFVTEHTSNTFCLYFILYCMGPQLLNQLSKSLKHWNKRVHLVTWWSYN